MASNADGKKFILEHTITESNPLITIRLQESDVEYRIVKSKLVKHSGFFRGMLSHEWKENTEQVVTLHDDEPGQLKRLIECMEDNYKLVVLVVLVINTADNLECHRILVDFLTILDKYLCKFLMHLVLIFIGRLALAKRGPFAFDGDPPEYLFNTADEFIDNHYHAVKAVFGRRYPEQLYPTFADVWCGISDTQMIESELDKDIKVAVGVANAFRRYLSSKHAQLRTVRQMLVGLE